jgi:hypothetical protein
LKAGPGRLATGAEASDANWPGRARGRRALAAQLYKHVWWGEPLRLEQTRHFSPEPKPRSFTEDPAHGDFWPVPVDGLMPEIHAALERLATAARSELAVLS